MSSKDLRLKRLMAKETAWDKAMKDPHLMQLGDFLVQIDKHAGWDWADSYHLEEQFCKEPWMNWLKVVLVVNPEMRTKPFVVMSSTRDQASHIECPFFNITGKEVEIFNLMKKAQSQNLPSKNDHANQN